MKQLQTLWLLVCCPPFRGEASAAHPYRTLLHTLCRSLPSDCLLNAVVCALAPLVAPGPVHVRAGFAADDSKTAEFLKSFAKQNRDDFSFGLVTDAAAAGDNKMDTIVLFKPFDEKQVSGWRLYCLPI